MNILLAVLVLLGASTARQEPPPSPPNRIEWVRTPSSEELADCAAVTELPAAGTAELSCQAGAEGELTSCKARASHPILERVARCTAPHFKAHPRHSHQTVTFTIEFRSSDE